MPQVLGGLSMNWSESTDVEEYLVVVEEEEEEDEEEEEEEV
jgi:hypothetical protein